MKTLYITTGANIIVDDEAKTADKLETQRSAINNIYLAEEPMHVVYGSGEYQRETDVEKDDLIISFYSRDFKHKMIVVKNQEWVENLVEYNKKQQEEKERWAASKDCTETISCGISQ